MRVELQTNMLHYYSLTAYSWRKEVHVTVIFCSTTNYSVHEVSVAIRYNL